jgi:hypothetical protein
MIDNSFDVMRAFPHSKLSIRACAFAHDSLDVSQLGVIAQLIHFRRDEREHFVQQISLVHLASAAKIDQLSIDAVARRAPAVFINQSSRIHAESDILPAQFL